MPFAHILGLLRALVSAESRRIEEVAYVLRGNQVPKDEKGKKVHALNDITISWF